MSKLNNQLAYGWQGPALPSPVSGGDREGRPGVDDHGLEEIPDWTRVPKY